MHVPHQLNIDSRMLQCISCRADMRINCVDLQQNFRLQQSRVWFHIKNWIISSYCCDVLSAMLCCALCYDDFSSLRKRKKNTENKVSTMIIEETVCVFVWSIKLQKWNISTHVKNTRCYADDVNLFSDSSSPTIIESVRREWKILATSTAPDIRLCWTQFGSVRALRWEMAEMEKQVNPSCTKSKIGFIIKNECKI